MAYDNSIGDWSDVFSTVLDTVGKTYASVKTTQAQAQLQQKQLELQQAQMRAGFGYGVPGVATQPGYNVGTPVNYGAPKYGAPATGLAKYALPAAMAGIVGLGLWLMFRGRK